MLADESSYYVFKEIYELTKQPVCLYQNFLLKIKTKQPNGNSQIATWKNNGASEIIGVRPSAINTTSSQNSQVRPLTLAKGINTVKISLDFSNPPFHKSYELT